MNTSILKETDSWSVRIPKLPSLYQKKEKKTFPVLAVTWDFTQQQRESLRVLQTNGCTSIVLLSTFVTSMPTVRIFADLIFVPVKPDFLKMEKAAPR